MMMFRRLKKKSLQRRAWCMGSFLCRELDEDVYVNVRHRLQRCGGAETHVKLSAKGWSSGGGRSMPSQFYALDMINAVEPDTVFTNILLCVFRRVDAAVDFPFETVAYKFENDKGPKEFHQLFVSLCPSQRNSGPGLVKKPSVLPARGKTGRSAGKQPALMPGRPTHGVMGAVTPDRWAAKDRATPRLFAARSLDDLLEENTSTSYVPGRRLSLDNDDSLDNELPGYDDDRTHTTSSCSTPSIQPIILPADTLLDGVNGALDGAWWSEDDEAAAATRTKDIGVAATFPDATDHLKQQRRAGLEFWVDGNDAACQAYVMPAPSKSTPVRCCLDDDDYDDEADEFKWVFSSSDEEDEQPVFDATFNTAVAQANAVKHQYFAEDRVGTAAVQDDMTSPSDRVRITYSRRVDQQKPVYANQQKAPVNRRLVSHKSSSRRYRVPSLHVAPRHPHQHTATSSASHVRRTRSDTSAGVAIRTTGESTTGVARVSRRPVSFRTGADRRRRVQSMSEYRQMQYRYAISQ